MVLLFGLLGAVAVASAVPAHEYTHAHTPVAVEGHRHLDMFCMGKGEPTVLLMAGGGEDEYEFRRVQGRIAATTRVCSYDRAGIGFSDPSPHAAGARAVVADLQRLVASGPLKPPVVLVGHSIGGLYAAFYAATVPASVAGLVLIDPTFPGQDAAITRGWTKQQLVAWRNDDLDSLRDARRCVALAAEGALARDPGKHADCLDERAGLDSSLHVLRNEQLARVTQQAALYDELVDTLPTSSGYLSTAEQALVDAHPDFGEKPLIVLTAGSQFAQLPEAQRSRSRAAWKAGHDALAAHSSRGRSVLIPGSSHFIEQDKPEAVIEAVVEVVREIRGGPH